MNEWKYFEYFQDYIIFFQFAQIVTTILFLANVDEGTNGIFAAHMKFNKHIHLFFYKTYDEIFEYDILK